MNVVAVHGAFRGGWCFGPLRVELAARGHDLRAPSLLGMGEHAPAPDRRWRVTLERWRDQIASFVELEDLDDVVFLGHSQGGLVVRAAAPGIVPRLRAIAYLDAPVPSPGQRGVDLMGPAPDQLPPEDTWLEPKPLAVDEHHSPQLVEWINPRLCATPLGPSLDPLPEDPVGVPAQSAVPVHSAFCAHTPEYYPGSWRRREMDRAADPYETIDAPHDAPLTHPSDVADWIEALGSDAI